jgi:hypothetical protein
MEQNCMKAQLFGCLCPSDSVDSNTTSCASSNCPFLGVNPEMWPPNLALSKIRIISFAGLSATENQSNSTPHHYFPPHATSTEGAYNFRPPFPSLRLYTLPQNVVNELPVL